MTPQQFLEEWRSPRPWVSARTSGSTGAPKEIRLLKADMRVSALATVQRFALGPGSRLHCPLAFDYIAAKMMAVRAELCHGTLTWEAPSAQPLRDIPDGERIDLLPIVPMQAPAVARQAPRLAIRTIIVGGAPLAREQEAALQSLAHTEVYATYGMTETASHVALRCVSRGESDFVALPGFTFATDGRGCLVINHDSMSACPLITNDVVVLTGENRFRWAGRADNTINSGGVKVQPEEVERVLAAMGATGLYYVTGRPHAVLGSEVVLVCDPRAVMPCADSELPALLRRALPPYHAPRCVLRRTVTLSERGKIVRQVPR